MHTHQIVLFRQERNNRITVIEYSGGEANLNLNRLLLSTYREKTRLRAGSGDKISRFTL